MCSNFYQISLPLKTWYNSCPPGVWFFLAMHWPGLFNQARMNLLGREYSAIDSIHCIRSCKLIWQSANSLGHQVKFVQISIILHPSPLFTLRQLSMIRIIKQCSVKAPSVMEISLRRRRDQFLFLYLRLDVTVPLNFRPIANVSFLSKIIERIVAAQLTHYMDTNNLLPIYQLRFRKGHTTETGLPHSCRTVLSWWPMVPLGLGGFLRHLDCPRAPFSVPSFT